MAEQHGAGRRVQQRYDCIMSSDAWRMVKYGMLGRLIACLIGSIVVFIDRPVLKKATTHTHGFDGRSAPVKFRLLHEDGYTIQFFGASCQCSRS